MQERKCTDESKELQEALERNHDLLPGDQINPDDPTRWLLSWRSVETLVGEASRCQSAGAIDKRTQKVPCGNQFWGCPRYPA